MNTLARIHRLDLHSLRLFSIVARDGSISRTAERNHIAASALSRRLSELEHVVGAPLLVRSRKGVEATELGRLVLQHAERIQEELRSLMENADALNDAQTTLRLCASHSVVGGVLPALLRAFNPGKEHVRVEISESSSFGAMEACAIGHADVGVGLGVRIPKPDSVESWTLWTDRLQVVLREDHFLARTSGLRWEQVLAFPIVSSNPAGLLFQQLQQEAIALGLNFNAHVTASNFSAACQLAESGLGVAVMPATAIPERLGPHLVQRPLLEFWASRPLVVYVNRKSHSARGVSALVQHVRGRAKQILGSRKDEEIAYPFPRLEPQFTVATIHPVS